MSKNEIVFNRPVTVRVKGQSKRLTRVTLAQIPGTEDKVKMYRSFDPKADSFEVPDPYGASLETYRRVVEMILPAAAGKRTATAVAPQRRTKLRSRASSVTRPSSRARPRTV